MEAGMVYGDAGSETGIADSNQCALINEGNLAELSDCKQTNNPLSVSKRVSDVCCAKSPHLIS